ncbi:MAG: bacterial virulence family protein [Herbaspirillum sp.]|jgi:type IV secretory pathway VirJ component|nr:bacterial virulence family protein [Herbaspirillum sp.]
MKSFFEFAARLASAAAALMLSATLSCAHAETVSHGQFHNVHIYKPEGVADSAVLLLSDDHGWDRRSARMARALTDQGALVVGIDTRDLTARLEADRGTCVFPDGDLENLSRFVQAYEKLPGYMPPVLAADGAGGALAYAVAAGSTADIFAGLLTVDFCPELALKKPLCKGAGVTFKPRSARDGVELLPSQTLRPTWIALQHRTVSELPGEAVTFPSCRTRQAQAFISSVPRAQMQLLPPPSPYPVPGVDLFPQWKAAHARLNVRPASAPASIALPAAVHDLPIVETMASGRSADSSDQLLAVFLSGDGGWAGLDRDVANALAKNGVPVVGVDSLRYFWSARTPASTATDVDRLIRFYLARWHKSKVILIGYSQGADVLPFIVNRLPPDTRGKVALTVMLALGRNADFQFRLSNWIKNSNDGLATRPELDRFDSGKYLCVYGTEEKDSGCPAVDSGAIKAVKLIGGHHFDGDYSGLANRILRAVR